jgi:hypothetical protein
MPKPAEVNSPEGENARVRMTLDLSKRLNDEIERLAAARQISKADILRFAVEFLSAADRAKQSGMTVGAWTDSAGKRKEREFVGL